MDIDPNSCCYCEKDFTERPQRYRCPGCERLYCSSACCIGHKQKYSCSGIRSKTPYVHRSNYEQKQFLDDYFFLEDVNNKIDKAARVLPKIIKTASNNKRK